MLCVGYVVIITMFWYYVLVQQPDGTLPCAAMPCSTMQLHDVAQLN